MALAKFFGKLIKKREKTAVDQMIVTKHQKILLAGNLRRNCDVIKLLQSNLQRLMCAGTARLQGPSTSVFQMKVDAELDGGFDISL